VCHTDAVGLSESCAREATMDEPGTITFGALLRQLRIDAGLTQQELARLAGVSERSVSDLERGVTLAVRNTTVQLLADGLKLEGHPRDAFTAAARGRLAVSGVEVVSGTAACTLPPDITLFTGRDPELRALTDSCDPATGTRVIGGMPGSGKTALAVHAAYRLRDRFPDCQLFIDLHGYTPGRKPVPPEAALAELLAAVGVDPRLLPRDLRGRAGLWRDRTAVRRALLVLDNAVDSDQVTPLLPAGDGCLVLVTSRRHLGDLQGVTGSIQLEGLQPAEASEMFLRLAPRTATEPEEDVAELVRLAGYLPLAISLLARVFAKHPSWKLADLITETKTSLLTLSAEKTSLAGVFEVSYRSLAADSALVLRRLSLHPGTTFDAFAVAALNEIPLPEASERLEILYDEGLLTEVGYRRYGMHDLIRRYAQQESRHDSAATRDQAMDWLLDYFQQASSNSQVRMARQPPSVSSPVIGGSPTLPDLNDRAQALSWSRAERPNLLACLDFVAATGLHARVVALTAALAALLRQDGPWPEAITHHAAAVDSARQIGDRRGEAIALSDLGDIRRLTGDYGGASEAARAALRIFRDLGERTGEANALTDLGSALYFLDEYAGATECQESALSIYRDLGERLGEGNALADIGAVRSVTGDFAGANEVLEAALDIFAGIGYLAGQANVLNYLGVARRLTGNVTGAVEALETALDLCRELGNPGSASNALTELGAAYPLLGDHMAAVAALSSALEICRGRGDRGTEAVALSFLGIARRSAGDYSGAAEALGDALAIFRDLGDRGGEANALNDIGAVYRLDHDMDRAEACHQQSLQLARKIGSEWDEAHALAGLGRCALSAGRHSEAIAGLRQALEIFQRIGAIEAPDVAAEVDALS
jgi:tetratricopeptide (TPR) repeat protein/transcriptional regulator with XRE-family HTH domain